ncbi:uncharacterized protein [Primulina huaijiensis]|uniref:uncharacterized protein n=1 Tax=Primulina huaijiensis TaxID=1492673 RepID=UPI003CC6E89E
MLHRLSQTFPFSLQPSVWTKAMAASLARQAANLAKLSSSSPSVAASRSASLVHRRGLASAAEHHGPPKVDFWKEPMNPGNWKEEHIVIVSLSGWGLVIFGGYKLFGGGKKEEKIVEAAR